MKTKGYVAGKTTSFTPSRDADWIEEFNNLLEETGHSVNKLTSMLIRIGLKHAKELNSSNQVASQSASKGVMIRSDKFTKEQLELLNTVYYQKILEEFTLHLLNAQEKAAENVLHEFKDNLQHKQESTSEMSAAVEEVLPNEKIENNEKEKLENITQTLEKADPYAALKLLKSMKD